MLNNIPDQIFTYNLLPFLSDKELINLVQLKLTHIAAKSCLEKRLNYMFGMTVSIHDYSFLLKYTIEQVDHTLNLTSAKQDFRVTDKQMSKLLYSTRPNKLYRGAAPVRVYSTKDVFKQCLLRHKSIANMTQYANKLTRMKQCREDKAQEKQKAIYRTLTESLQKVGLTLRSDSKLCHLYLSQGEQCGWTADRVAQRMAEVKYMFDYVPKFTRTINGLRNSDTYYPDLVEAAQMKLNINFPSYWPWLQQTSTNSIKD